MPCAHRTAEPKIERCAAVARALTPVGSGTRTLSEEAARSIHGALDEASGKRSHAPERGSQNGPRRGKTTAVSVASFRNSCVGVYRAEFYIGQISRRLCKRPSSSWQTYSLLPELIKGLIVAAFLHVVHGMGFEKTAKSSTNVFWVELLRARNRLYCGTGSLVRAGSALRQAPFPACRCGVDRHAGSKKYSLNYARRLEVQEMAAGVKSPRTQRALPHY